MTARRAVVLALVAVLVVAGCGLRGEDEPREMAAEDVPFGLLAESTTTTAPFPAEGSVPVTVYLVNSDRKLVGVDRLAPGNNATGVMRALVPAATEEESARGLTNSIPEDTQLRDVREGASPDTVVVNLSAEFLRVQGPVQVSAVAQVVWTITELPNIRGVQFAFEGEIRPVPRGDGETTSEPLRRSSFADLAPEG